MMLPDAWMKYFLTVSFTCFRFYSRKKFWWQTVQYSNHLQSWWWHDWSTPQGQGISPSSPFYIHLSVCVCAYMHVCVCVCVCVCVYVWACVCICIHVCACVCLCVCVCTCVCVCLHILMSACVLFNECIIIWPWMFWHMHVYYFQIHMFDIDVPGKIRFQESEVLSPGNTLTSFDTRKSVLFCFVLFVFVCTCSYSRNGMCVSYQEAVENIIMWCGHLYNACHKVWNYCLDTWDLFALLSNSSACCELKHCQVECIFVQISGKGGGWYSISHFRVCLQIMLEKQGQVFCQVLKCICVLRASVCCLCPCSIKLF